MAEIHLRYGVRVDLTACASNPHENAVHRRVATFNQPQQDVIADKATSAALDHSFAKTAEGTNVQGRYVAELTQMEEIPALRDSSPMTTGQACC